MTILRVGTITVAIAMHSLLAGDALGRRPDESTGQAEDPARSLAKDLVRAMLLHDQSIRSLDWCQVAWLENGQPGSLRTTSRQCFDDGGRWAIDYTNYRGGDPKPGYFRFDGHALTAVNPTLQQATIGEDTGHRKGFCSIEAWLGRTLVAGGRARLGEVLLDASDLTLSGYSSLGCPVVSATVGLRDHITLLEVEIDPEHGFAPRAITQRDRALRVPYDRHETTTFVQVAGIWLPQCGRELTRQFSPTPEERAKFAASVAKRNLSPGEVDFFDPRVQTLYAEAVQEAFGAAEATSAPLVDPWIVVVTEYKSVNGPIPDARVQWTVDASFGVFDALLNLDKPAGSNVWRDNTPRPRASPPP